MTRIKQTAKQHWWWVLSLAFVALGVALVMRDVGGNRALAQVEAPPCPDCTGQPDGNGCCGGYAAPDCASPTGNYACCDGTWYDTTSQGCCNGIVYDLSEIGCCNGQTYVLDSQTCCGGTGVTDGVNECCVNGVPTCCCSDGTCGE